MEDSVNLELYFFPSEENSPFFFSSLWENPKIS